MEQKEQGGADLTAAEIVTGRERHLVPVLVIAAEAPEQGWAGRSKHEPAEARGPGHR